MGVVIVPPVGHERLRCYRECVNFARDLARAGYPVLRFDYRGEGESSGAFEESDVVSRLLDICAAVDELRKISGIKDVCLFGFRLGAVFSLMSAKEVNCKCLVLCEPLFELKEYIRTLIRAHIITVKEYFPDVKISSEDVIEKMANDETISVYGFHITGEYLQQLAKIDVDKFIDDYDGYSCILTFSRKNTEDVIPESIKQWHEKMNMAGTCQHISVETAFSWMTKKIWTDRISDLAEKAIMSIRTQYEKE